MARDTKLQDQSDSTDVILGDERLFHEINLLRIEGFAFCFDPKAAGRRKTKQDFVELIKMAEGSVTRPVTIEPHPSYGTPTVLAYRILQASLKKLSDEGYEGAESIAFSQRELARLIGWKSFSGQASADFLRAILSLRYTGIWCSFYDKETGGWKVLNFSIFIDALFSGRKSKINECVFTFHPRIVSSLRNRHYVCLNYNRLTKLEPIGMALFKHLFFNMSRLRAKLGKTNFVYERDYEAICKTWLGGLEVRPYRTLILRDQLGRHLASLKQVQLIKSFDIVKNGSGGFKLEVVPGSGFFEDYERFYGKNKQLPFPFKRTEEEHDIARPLKLVSHFHKRRLGVDDLTEYVFSEKEVAFARTLVQKYPDEVCREIVDYGLERAGQQKNYKPQTLPGIGQFINDFFATKSERDRQVVREEVRRKEATIERQKERYELFYKNEIMRLRKKLSPEQLGAMEAPLREEFRKKYPDALAGVEMYILFRGNEILEKKYKIPGFEEWQATNANA
jgi:hypothetical protein